MLIIVGDLNAKIGREDSAFWYHNETNRNGEMLVEISQKKACDLKKVFPKTREKVKGLSEGWKVTAGLHPDKKKMVVQCEKL